MDEETSLAQLVDLDDAEVDIKRELDVPSEGKNERIETLSQSVENKDIDVQGDKKESFECESGSECDYMPSNEENSAATIFYIIVTEKRRQ